MPARDTSDAVLLEELRTLGRADRRPILHLREHLSVIAAYGPAAASTINQARDVLAPFYPR